MKPQIRYIELKSGFSHDGPAWIGKVEFSKLGQTIYFDGKAIKKLKIPGVTGNHFDVETGEEYWVSGVKKNGSDRHWAGGGRIMLDRSSVNDYLELVDFNVIDERHFELVDFQPTDTAKFAVIENAEIGAKHPHQSVEAAYWENNRRKFE